MDESEVTVVAATRIRAMADGGVVLNPSIELLLAVDESHSRR